jgi:hypothetical protein
VSPFPPAHVNAPTFQSSRCLPPERIRACALSSACPANALSDACFANALSSACEEWLRAAGQRGSHRTCSSKVRKPRLDPCPLAIRERLQGRGRHFGFCRWMFPRARPGPLEHPVPRRVVGTTAMLDAKSNLLELPLRARQPPKVRRVRGREHRVSTLPTVIAHGEDFAPTPIASGTSCRGYRSLPGPE